MAACSSSARPGTWLMRCDGEGRSCSRSRRTIHRCCASAATPSSRDRLLTTETDHATGRGRIGVRDLRTPKKLDDWDTHGIDPTSCYSMAKAT